jgi:hypothetical protein
MTLSGAIRFSGCGYTGEAGDPSLLSLSLSLYLQRERETALYGSDDHTHALELLSHSEELLVESRRRLQASAELLARTAHA